MKRFTYGVLLLMLLLMGAVFLPGCSKKSGEIHSAAEEKGEPLQVTAYSERSELFMEFVEPVAGEKGTFLFKLTRLSDWKPVSEGALKLIFTPASGAPVSFTVPSPARPGIYRTELTLATAGEYALDVIPEGPGFADRIRIPEIHVVKKGEEHKGHEGHAGHAGHADEKGAAAAGAKESGHDAEDEHGHEEKGEQHAKAESHGKVDHGQAGKDEGHAEHGEGDHDEHAEADHGKHGEAGHDKHAEEEHGEEGHHEEGRHEEGRVIYGTGGGAIPFLKEQQWATDFMSRPAQSMDLATYFSTMGELVPVSNAEATVSAPLSGIVSVARPLPFLGKRVSKGEIVALIEPPVQQEGGIGELAASYAEAKNRVTLAQKEYDRAKRLYEAKIAPLKRVEEAELTLSSSRAALQPLEKAVQSVKADSSNGRIALRAPVSGTVVEIAAANGRGIQAGEPILRIINTGTLWLKANIPASDAGKASLAAGATFTVTGVDGEFRPSRLVTVAGMLDPQTRTLPVIFEMPNPRGALKVGMFANVSIRTGISKNALAGPKEALVEDEGRWFVFVQTAAEAFERREVKVGAQDKGHVEIVEGLKDHERVVVKGAYYVKLAATAGKAPDPHAGHGH